MNPKNLNSPFSWDERRVYLDIFNRIFYVPARCEKIIIRDLFKKILNPFKPTYLEFCSGNGQWIAQKAKDHPNIQWIAVEMKFDRVQKIWSKMQNLKLDNLWIFCAEAFELCNHYIPNDVLDEIFINFPDPWPKKKHAKYRLLQPHFIQQLYRILKSDRIINFVTDDSPYSKETINHFLELQNHFQPVFEAPYYQSDLSNYGQSYFKSLWEEKKRAFYFSKFQKKCKH